MRKKKVNYITQKKRRKKKSVKWIGATLVTEESRGCKIKCVAASRDAEHHLHMNKNIGQI